MTGSTKIWIWISVAIVLIAGLSVGGFFLLKNSGNDESNDDENGEFTPSKNNSSNGGTSNNDSNSSSNSDSTTTNKTTSKSAYANAYILKEAIYGIGTDYDAIINVFKSVSTQDEINEIYASYFELTENSFKDDLAGELQGIMLKAEINKILKEKNLTSNL